MVQWKKEIKGKNGGSKPLRLVRIKVEAVTGYRFDEFSDTPMIEDCLQKRSDKEWKIHAQQSAFIELKRAVLTNGVDHPHAGEKEKYIHACKTDSLKKSFNARKNGYSGCNRRPQMEKPNPQGKNAHNLSAIRAE